MIFAFDQSLKVTGVAVFEDKRLVDFFHFSIAPNQDLGIRLCEIKTKVLEIVDKYNSDSEVQIVFEDIQKQTNAQTFKRLAMVQSVFYQIAAEQNWKYEVLAPATWRHLIKEKTGCSFGRTRADQKAKAKEVVRTLYKISPTEDEADAILIGTAFIETNHSQKSAF